MLASAILAGDELNGRVLGVVVAGLGGLAVIAAIVALVMAAYLRSRQI